MQIFAVLGQKPKTATKFISPFKSKNFLPVLRLSLNLKFY